MKDKRIGVLLGGLGPERDVSLRTGEAIANALRRLGYDAQEVFVDRDIDQVLRQTPIDVAFLALHGPYGEDGKLPICFIGTNHTTGGNSGSPAIDAYGNLIGLNFDRVWEGTMSDINYDASICRNIMVDIRYILFIIDKYAGAGHLVEEMQLAHPKG